MTVDLDKLDRNLFFLNKKIKFSLLTPVNTDQEKRKLMKDRTYDPQLQYKTSDIHFAALKKELIDLRFDDSILGKLLAYKRNDLLKTVLMLEHIGKERFTSSCLNLYGRPD